MQDVESHTSYPVVWAFRSAFSEMGKFPRNASVPADPVVAPDKKTLGIVCPSNFCVHRCGDLALYDNSTSSYAPGIRPAVEQNGDYPRNSHPIHNFFSGAITFAQDEREISSLRRYG